MGGGSIYFDPKNFLKNKNILPRGIAAEGLE